ncbi:MAG: cadherin repeat domain-containing protein, partial [Anaerolineales bacterium]|nr:cadherin repeat domain-containing protein [Anaerolineales bacterium]
SDIGLSRASVIENSAAGTVVGGLTATDADAGETFAFSLLDDAGGRFAINGANLVVAGALDYEAATSLGVSVRVTDAVGNTFDKAFAIGVGNAISASSIAENRPYGTVVGALSGTDPDAGDLLMFSLFDDAGGRFAINGANVVVAGELDCESATAHSITVRATDSGGAFRDE